MSTVVVTGASGFVGRRVLPILAERGHEVHAVSRRAPQGGSGDAHAWHELDLLDPTGPERLFDEVKPARLLHLAWCTEHARFWEAPENADWVAASIRLWRSFREVGGTRFVGVGSCAEYEWGTSPLTEAGTAARPASFYGVSKDAFRRVLEGGSKEDPRSWAWGRLFFVYGPEKSSERLVSFVAESLLDGRKVPTTDGEQVRDYLHVDDVARALCALVDSTESGAYNIGSGVGHRVRDIVETLGQLCDAPDLIEFGAISRPPNDAPAVVADVAKMRRTGWTPSVDLADGLVRTVAAIRSAGEQSLGGAVR